MATDTEFRVEDYIPDRDVITNKRVPTECPVCGEEELIMWHILPLPFPFMRCYGCDFLGNPAHLYSEIHDMPYSVSMAKWENSSEIARETKDIFDKSMEMEGDLARCQKLLRGDYAAFRPSFSRQFGWAPSEVAAFSRMIGYVPQGMTDHRQSDMFVVPLYYDNSIICTLQWHPPYRAYERIGPREKLPAGWLDLSGGEGPVILSGDIHRVIDLTAAHQLASTSGETAPIIYFPDIWYLTPLAVDPHDQIVVFAEELTAQSLSILKQHTQVRYTFEGMGGIRRHLHFGSTGFMDGLWRRSSTFHEMVLEAIRRSDATLLEHLRGAQITAMDLSELHAAARPSDHNGVSDLWPGFTGARTRTVRGKTYQISEDGHISRVVHQSGGVFKSREVSNCHLDISERVIGDGRTLHRGTLISGGHRISVEVQSPWTRLSLVRDLRRASRQIDLEPDFSPRDGERWMNINLHFSSPEKHAGHPRCGYYPESGLVLPGVAISEEDISEVGLITRPDTDFLDAPEFRSHGGLITDTAFKRLCLMVHVTLGVKLASKFTEANPIPSCLLCEDSRTMRLVQNVASALGLDRDVEGYPRLIDQLHPDGLSVREASRTGEIGAPSHVAFIPTPEHASTSFYVPKTQRILMWKTLQAGLRSDERSSGCVCHRFLSWMEHFLDTRGVDYDLRWLRDRWECYTD